MKKITEFIYDEPGICPVCGETMSIVPYVMARRNTASVQAPDGDGIVAPNPPRYTDFKFMEASYCEACHRKQFEAQLPEAQKRKKQRLKEKQLKAQQREAHAPTRRLITVITMLILLVGIIAFAVINPFGFDMKSYAFMFILLFVVGLLAYVIATMWQSNQQSKMNAPDLFRRMDFDVCRTLLRALEESNAEDKDTVYMSVNSFRGIKYFDTADDEEEVAGEFNRAYAADIEKTEQN